MPLDKINPIQQGFGRIFIKPYGSDDEFKEVGGLKVTRITIEESKEAPSFDQIMSGDLNLSFSLDDTWKTRRTLAKLRRMAKEKPFKILYHKLWPWDAIRIWWAVRKAKKEHKPIGLISEDKKHVIIARDINEIL